MPKSCRKRPSHRPLRSRPISDGTAFRCGRVDTTSRPTMSRTSPRSSVSLPSPVQVTRPSRSTVIRSASASTSEMWCEMNTTATPLSRSRLTRSRICWAASGPRHAVGSSRISTRPPRRTSRATSTMVCSATVRSPATASTSMSSPSPCNARRAVSRIVPQRTTDPLAGRSPSMMFSATVSVMTSSRRCGTIETPSLRACRGFRCFAA